MIAFQYNSDGFYAGAIEDFGLLPSNSTYKKPVQKNGFIQKWNGQDWEDVENHKGEKGYLNGQPFEIRGYGPYPEGFSLELPEPSAEEKLAAAITRKTGEIETKYQQALEASLTMPQDSPNHADIAIGAALFASEDAEGLEYIAQTHANRKNELLACLGEASTPEDVEAIRIVFDV